MAIGDIISRKADKPDGVDVEKFDAALYRSFRNQLWFFHSWTAAGLLLCFCAFQAYFTAKLQLNWMDPVLPTDLIKMQGAYRPLMFFEEPWRLILSIFVHSSPVSLAINGLALLSIGALVDRYEGPLRMFLLFLFSAVSANLISAFFQSSGTVWSGATGGIMGLYLGLICVSFKVDWRLFRKFDWFILPFFLWDAFSHSENIAVSFSGAILGTVFMIVVNRQYFSSRGAKSALLLGWAVFGYLAVDKLLPTLTIVQEEIEFDKKGVAAKRTEEILDAAKNFLNLRESFENRRRELLAGRLAIPDMKVWMINDFQPDLKNMRQTLAHLRSPTMKIYAVQKSVFEDVILLDKICQEMAQGFVGDQLPYWDSISQMLEPSLKNILSALEDAGAAKRTAGN